MNFVSINRNKGEKLTREYVILWRFLYAKLYKIERQNLNFNSIMFSISFQEFQKFYKRKIYKHWFF